MAIGLVKHKDLNQPIRVEQDLAVVADDLLSEDVLNPADEFGGDHRLAKSGSKQHYDER